MLTIATLIKPVYRKDIVLKTLQQRLMIKLSFWIVKLMIRKKNLYQEMAIIAFELKYRGKSA